MGPSAETCATALVPGGGFPVLSGGRVKGTAIVELLLGTTADEGAAEVERIWRGVASPWREQLDVRHATYGILRGSWYPVELMAAIYDSMTAGISVSAQARKARDIADGYVERMVRGVYKVVFDLFVTPERFAANAQRVWKQTYDSGTLTMRIDGEGNGATGVTRGWTGHHPFACLVTNQIGRAVFETIGCENVTAMLVCRGATGDQDCVGTYRWTGRT